MQRWVEKHLLACLAAAVFWTTPAAPALAQQADPPRVQADALDDAMLEQLLSRGRQFEVERRWGEALAHYEEALHEWPDARPLRQRFELAKLHYDHGRRYADTSFRNATRQMAGEEALHLYNEVLLKIQSHYVQEPNWKRLVQWGTSALEVALTEPTFLSSQVAPGMTAAQIDDFRRQLRDWVNAQAVPGRLEAREAVASAARMAERQLGLRESITVLEYTCGATNSLDDYSTFLTADQLDEVYSQIDGNFVGLGIELKSNGGVLVIVNVITGSPADRQGILAGDEIVAIEGRNTSELSTDQAAALLQGQEGSQVQLTAVTPGGRPRTVAIRREHVDVPSIDDVHILDPDQGIGYLKLTCFQKTTTRDLDDALWKLHREGMKSLVMDLRGNPGGLLTTSVEVADKFVERGTIVSTRGRNPHEDFTYSAHLNGTWQIPLAVLIDGDSASASEIFAGCIRDHQRGLIIGDRSYGKGSVQGIFPLSPVANLPAAGLRLTTARFYSPLGRPYSKVGVEPDLKVQLTARPVAGEVPGSQEDAVVVAAVNALRRQLARRNP
ncbi:MAG: S41 family peptidase [Pirellulales bacterium]|nr:S41 family peptidase [Pirellulales bacterium]